MSQEREKEASDQIGAYRSYRGLWSFSVSNEKMLKDLCQSHENIRSKIREIYCPGCKYEHSGRGSGNNSNDRCNLCSRDGGNRTKYMGVKEYLEIRLDGLEMLG